MNQELFDIYVLRENYSIKDITQFIQEYLTDYVCSEDKFYYYDNLQELTPSYETDDLMEFLNFLAGTNEIYSVYFRNPISDNERGFVFLNDDNSVLLGKRFIKKDTIINYYCFTKEFGVDNVFCTWSENIPNRKVGRIKEDVKKVPELIELIKLELEGSSDSNLSVTDI